MPSEPAKIDPSIEEQLVAYLDGELDTQASSRIEELLASDPKVREALQRLDHTWDLLDQLDGPPVSEEQVQSTLEMVTIAAADDLEHDRAQAPRRRLRRSAVVLATLAAAGLAGFLAAGWFKPDPDAELIRDLPVVESFEQYRRVDDVEVLRLLNEEGVFDDELAEEIGTVAQAAESYADRRRRVERMGSEEREELRRLRERFGKLPPDEQQRLQRLHEQIDSDPKAEQLRLVMQHYTEWLKTLPPYTRARLLALEPAERVQRIKELRQEEAQRGLGRRDVETLIRWTEEYVEKHESDVLTSLPEPVRERMSKLSPAQRHVWMMWLLWNRWQRPGPGRGLPLTEEDVAGLRSRLSKTAQAQLDASQSTEAREIVGGWTRRALANPVASQYFRTTLDAAFQEQLDRFFEKELTDAQRDRLLSLPGDEMLRELRGMYFRSTFGVREGPDRRGPGPRRGNGPGPPGTRGPERGRPRPPEPSRQDP